jgi:predicted enzyme involved in methoxymalonyl-ACP biosynthesis
VEREAKLAIDLMFSCCVQSKQVEHALLIYLLRKYRAGNTGDFCVSYRRTSRNANVAKVFDDLGFELQSEKNGVSILRFRANREIPENSIVSVVQQPDQ